MNRNLFCSQRRCPENCGLG